MSGFLIDTNVISEFVKPSPSIRVRSWFEAADTEALFVSVVTFGEIRLGLEDMPHSKRRSELELWFQKGLPDWFESNLLTVTKPVADRWARLTIAAKRNGISVATAGLDSGYGIGTRSHSRDARCERL